MDQQPDRSLDVVGVGIGPFNLSVAALMASLDGVDSLFFDARPEFQWHPGCLFPDATIQNSCLKDLVTLADPTSPYSFFNFLFQKRRFYRFLAAGFPKILRQEYNQYLRWVCDALPNLHFSQPVESIDFDGRSLVVTTGANGEPLARRRFETRNVVLGTGLSPIIPDCVRPHLGSQVVHSSHFLGNGLDPVGKRVAVIGSGQSGGEVVAHLLSSSSAMPSKIHWISAQDFLPLDDSPFTEEIFNPAYSNHFFKLRREVRSRLLVEQRLASDGVSLELLEKIYRRLYELEFIEEAGRRCELYPATKLMGMSASQDGWYLDLHEQRSDRFLGLEVDCVILATGFGYQVPDCLEALKPRIEFISDNQYLIQDDFSIRWDGPSDLKIYVQNAARHCRGIPDPNLSLMAWRSATIINSILGETVFDVEDSSSVFDWNALRLEPDLQTELQEA